MEHIDHHSAAITNLRIVTLSKSRIGQNMNMSTKLQKIMMLRLSLNRHPRSLLVYCVSTHIMMMMMINLLCTNLDYLPYENERNV